MDAIDPGAGERLLQHADHWYHSGHRALEPQLDALRPRDLPQLLAEPREELLVGRDDVTPGTHRAHHVVVRRFDPAHQLDDQLRAFEQVVERPLAPGQDPGQ